VQANFRDYPILTISETPKIEVHIVQRRDDPRGVGEPGVPPIAPALANAVFAACGQRIRALPIRAVQLGER
jgi:isoquinoline 1-oxidoreductase subunit beta